MSTEYYQKKGYKKQKVCQCGERFLGNHNSKYCYDCKEIRKKELASVYKSYRKKFKEEKQETNKVSDLSRESSKGKD